MWWQEARHPSVRGTGVPPPLGSAACSAPHAASAGMHATPAAAMPVAHAAPAYASPRRGSQGWGSSSDKGDNYQGTGSSSQRLPGPWVSSCSQPPPPPDVRTGHLLASTHSTARCGSALTTPLLAVAARTGLMRGAPNSPARQAGTPLSLLTFTQIGNRLPRNSRPVALLVMLFVLTSAAGV